jgi:hypothetical protein
VRNQVEDEGKKIYTNVKNDLRKYEKMKSSQLPVKNTNKLNEFKRMNSAGSRVLAGGLVPVPEVTGKEPEDYDKLKAKIVHTIIDYRIYKNEDIDSLFGRIMLYNKHLDPLKLQDMLEYIKEEFEK